MAYIGTTLTLQIATVNYSETSVKKTTSQYSVIFQRSNVQNTECSLYSQNCLPAPTAVRLRGDILSKLNSRLCDSPVSCLNAVRSFTILPLSTLTCNREINVLTFKRRSAHRFI
jgi:hypothetical protein